MKKSKKRKRESVRIHKLMDSACCFARIVIWEDKRANFSLFINLEISSERNTCVYVYIYYGTKQGVYECVCVCLRL